MLMFTFQLEIDFVSLLFGKACFVIFIISFDNLKLFGSLETYCFFNDIEIWNPG